jgi:hypothetical protein
MATNHFDTKKFNASSELVRKYFKTEMWLFKWFDIQSTNLKIESSSCVSPKSSSNWKTILTHHNLKQILEFDIFGLQEQSKNKEIFPKEKLTNYFQ